MVEHYQIICLGYSHRPEFLISLKKKKKTVTASKGYIQEPSSRTSEMVTFGRAISILEQCMSLSSHPYNSAQWLRRAEVVAIGPMHSLTEKQLGMIVYNPGVSQ